jgi:guanylate kinase
VRPERRGRLFVVSAPSGAGKTTLCNRAIAELPGLVASVSYTTRQARPGELQDVHYTFITQPEFRSMIERGDFAEWAEVHSNLYGTSRPRIEAVISGGGDIILDIDVQGARRIRESYPDSVLIFILPPSTEALKERLIGRMSDSEEVIERRLRNAREEIGEYKRYDYVIVNNVLERAYDVFRSIIMAERNKTGFIDHEWIEEHFLGRTDNGR